MPLFPNQLAEQIQKFTDKDAASFVGFPVTGADAASAWANAVDSYVNGGLDITPPSAAGVAARAVLEAGLLGMAAPDAAIVAFNAAFTAWAVLIAAGMAPSFVATPPPAPIAITPPTMATIFAAGIAGADGATQALALATLIDAWIRTGTSTPSGGGPVSPWG